MSKYHTVRIEGGPAPADLRVWLDEKELVGVKDFTLTAGVHEALTLNVTLIVEAKVSANAFIKKS